jgi:hypothetical protein
MQSDHAVAKKKLITTGEITKFLMGLLLVICLLHH